MATDDTSREPSGARTPPRPGDGSATARRVVASYDSYAEAERAVDFLADQEFQVERAAIVAQGLRFVEQVTGRMTYWQAAVRNALSGAVIGVLFGWIFGLFNLIDPLAASVTLALYGLIFGAVVGALIGLVVHAMSGGRRDFASIGQIQAERYEVLVDGELADDAARLLEGMPARGSGSRA